MKKIISVFTLLSFGLLLSQEIRSKKPTLKSKANTYQKADSDTVKKNNGKYFYKNIDSAKASQYKILNKKPSNQYSELLQTERDTTLYRSGKPKDSVLLKKKKK